MMIFVLVIVPVVVFWALAYPVLLTVNKYVWKRKGISIDKKSSVYKRKKRVLKLISIPLAIIFYSVALSILPTQSLRPRPTIDWFQVSFDDKRVQLTAQPKAQAPWAHEFQWTDIQRVCFKAEDLMGSDEIHVFTAAHPEGYAIPTEGKGGA